ncbi:MAG: hypothetical protein ACFE9L_11465 [Candidatus Hodarchaeota archaeon]
MSTSYQVLKGALWTKFEDTKGALPISWTPTNLSDEIQFSVSLRGISVFSSRPPNISYSKMLATIPFPEYELVAISTVLYEASETSRGGFDINLVSVLIPSFLFENAWIDIRQIQAVFQEYFETYQGKPVQNKDAIIENIAVAIDAVLKRKLLIIAEGEKVREQLTRFLDSYLVTSRSKEERELIRTRIKTLIQLLDRVLEAGDHTRLQKALERMIFTLQQEFKDEVPLISQFESWISNIP